MGDGRNPVTGRAAAGLPMGHSNCSAASRLHCSSDCHDPLFASPAPLLCRAARAGGCHTAGRAGRARRFLIAAAAADPDTRPGWPGGRACRSGDPAAQRDTRAADRPCSGAKRRDGIEPIPVALSPATGATRTARGRHPAASHACCAARANRHTARAGGERCRHPRVRATRPRSFCAKRACGSPHDCAHDNDSAPICAF